MLFDYQQYFKILCSGSLIIIALAIVLIAMMLFNSAPAAINWREKVKAQLKSKKEAKEAK